MGRRCSSSPSRRRGSTRRPAPRCGTSWRCSPGEELLTILLTTHYLEEADALTDRLAIVSRGHIVVEGTAEELKESMQGEAVVVELVDGTVNDAAAVLRALAEVREVSIDGKRVRSRVDDGARAVAPILAALDSRGIAVESVTMHRPSLDDVYLHYTGRDFSAEDEAGGEG